MKKRLLAIIATVAMVVAMMPSMVFGAEVTTFGDFQTALSGTETEITYSLSADVDLGVISSGSGIVIPEGKNVTIDLNGKSISGKSATPGTSLIENKGKLTIIDSGTDGKITFTYTGTAAGFTGNVGNYTITTRNELIVKDGTIENLSNQNTPGNVVHMYCAIQQSGGTTTIEGGVISTPTYRSIRVNKGTLNIIGGTMNGQVWLQPNQGDSILNVTGGSFAPTGGDGSSIFMTNTGENYTVSDANIEGGNFATKIGASTPANLEGAITGGTFTEEAVNAMNANGKSPLFAANIEDEIQIEDAAGNKVHVFGKDPVEEALKNVEEGDKVTVVADSDGKIEVPAGTEVFNNTENDIEINGKKFTTDESADGVLAPEKPEEPSTPVDPEDPAAPEQPEVNQGGEGEATPEPEDEVDTGDNMNVVIPFAIAALALAAMGTVVATRRRHN